MTATARTTFFPRGVMRLSIQGSLHLVVFPGSLIQLVDDHVQFVLDLVEPVVEVFDEMSDPDGNGEHCGQQRL